MLTMTKPFPENFASNEIKRQRIESIDLLRGIVMIIMALDHVRAFFHYDAFYFSPTDLTQTSGILFFTRFITHYCAPVFVFLAGISAFLYGVKKTKKELAFYLFTRGLWLLFVELFIISFGRTFNSSYPLFVLQVIWAIGISMIVLAAMIYISLRWILLTSLIIIIAHNVLDTVHVPGNGLASFAWSALHETGVFSWAGFNIHVSYPVLPWIGVIALGYWFGSLYAPGYNAQMRRKILLSLGVGAIFLFILLRVNNFYGDSSNWSIQKNAAFSFLSFLNVTKYPPSLHFVLVTLGPALVFLSQAEKPLNALTGRIAVFGRVPFFYYVLHFYLIHLFAMIGVIILGYHWSDMILWDRPNNVAKLKGYGFGLPTVYIVWIGLVLILYPICNWYDRYKRTHYATKRWLTYL